MLKKITIPVLAFALLSCNQAKENKASTGFLYFDLKEYFNAEALRLQKLNPTLQKTVIINGDVENKSVKVGNWEQELSIFANADINKTAWAGKFEVKKTDSSVLYQSNDRKIDIKSICIKKNRNIISSIEIIAVNDNNVFQSTDTLKYVPNQFYKINKTQKIQLLQKKNYQVKAVFDK